jgi:hypothetical protein
MIPGISYYYKMNNLPLDIWFLILYNMIQVFKM